MYAIFSFFCFSTKYMLKVQQENIWHNLLLTLISMLSTMVSGEQGTLYNVFLDSSQTTHHIGETYSTFSIYNDSSFLHSLVFWSAHPRPSPAPQICHASTLVLEASSLYLYLCLYLYLYLFLCSPHRHSRK